MEKLKKINKNTWGTLSSKIWSVSKSEWPWKKVKNETQTLNTLFQNHNFKIKDQDDLNMYKKKCVCKRQL